MTVLKQVSLQRNAVLFYFIRPKADVPPWTPSGIHIPRSGVSLAPPTL